MKSFFSIQLGVVFNVVSFVLCGASPYAQKCERVIGVPVPVIDCSDPNGSEVSVGKISNGKCENPSHGLSECNPGTKFIRFEDTFKREGKTEKVVTMIMCRKTTADMGRGPEGRDVYSDIGVIQFNETKNATCWFSRTGDNQKPTMPVGEGANRRMAYPSPSDRNENFWGAHQPESRCIDCHQGGVWLRTPFASGVEAEKGKGYKRADRLGNYQPGDGNHIPDNHTTTSKRGISCAVGKPEWNVPDGSQSPFQIKINVEKAAAKLGAVAPGQAPLSTCTRCHYIGTGGGGTLSCETFLNEFKGKNHKLRLPDPSKHFWMPPREAPSSIEEYLKKYGRALDAVAWCCDREKNGNDADYRAICGEKFKASGPDRENLERLNLAGPCGLCAGGVEAKDCEDEDISRIRNRRDNPREAVSPSNTSH